MTLLFTLPRSTTTLFTSIQVNNLYVQLGQYFLLTFYKVNDSFVNCSDRATITYRSYKLTDQKQVPIQKTFLSQHLSLGEAMQQPFNKLFRWDHGSIQPSFKLISHVGLACLLLWYQQIEFKYFSELSSLVSFQHFLIFYNVGICFQFLVCCQNASLEDQDKKFQYLKN